jgi:hypothetical protein
VPGVFRTSVLCALAEASEAASEATVKKTRRIRVEVGNVVLLVASSRHTAGVPRAPLEKFWFARTGAVRGAAASTAAQHL